MDFIDVLQHAKSDLLFLHHVWQKELLLLIVRTDPLHQSVCVTLRVP